ncbi:hypothetical protein ACFW04_014451 [Cataglyphis niger]
MLNEFIESLSELDELEIRQLFSLPEIALDYFELPKSTGHHVFKEIVTIVAGLVVGIIDGCIPIKAPAGNPIDFYNRNKDRNIHSIILQGVYDHKTCFINSELFAQLNNVENILLSPNIHLLGNSAYFLMKNLMTFRDNGYLTREQNNYNVKLKYLDISDAVLGNTIIATACVIHNFLIDCYEIDFEHEVPIKEPMPISNDDRE